MGGWGQNNLTGALLDYYHWNELEVEAYKGTIYKHRAIQKKDQETVAEHHQHGAHQEGYL